MKPEHGAEKPQPSGLAVTASIVAHLLLLIPTLYIVGLSIEAYTLFAWHPICGTLGAGLLVAEAIFSISGEAYISKKLSRPSRVILHWILHSVGLTLVIVSLIIIIINKNNKGSDHFTTTHGQLGLVTIVVTVVVALFGILANNARWFYPKLRPVLLKVLHAFGGILATILLLASVINGTYKDWWTKIGASETGRDLVFAALFIAGFIVLVKPLIGAISRSRVLARPPPAAPVAMSETAR